MAPKLHSYQEVARDFLQARPRSALFLDMGWGKTATVLSALTPEHLPALVIAPKRVAEHVWPTEAALWRPDLSLIVAKGDRVPRRGLLRAGGADITVLGRDNIRDIEDMKVFPWKTVVLDELSGFKSPSSVRFKVMRKTLRVHGVPHVWGMTGTPAPNGLLDLWAQVYLLDEGHRLGKTLTEYRSRMFMPGRQLANGVITEWVPRAETAKKVHTLLEDICLAMGEETEGRVKLPPIHYNRVEVFLPRNARQVYETMKKDLLVQLDVLGDTRTVVSSNAAVMTGKLSQVSAGFVYESDGLGGGERGEALHLHDEKIRAVREIIEGTGGNVLVFYRFQEERRMLEDAFPEARGVDSDGAIEAWNRGEIPVMLAHPASAGHGLNLQHGGHTIVWTTLPWSLEEWEQANKRLARQGQTRPVVVHTVAAAGTIDDVIADRLEGKADVQNALLAHLETAGALR